MMLTDAQIAALRQIIADYHQAFVINYLSPNVVPPTVLARLQELGLVKPEGNSLENAYVYGKLLQMLNTPAAAKMSYPQFEAYLKKNPISLTAVEQQAVNIAATRGAQFVVGLGNKIATDTGQMLIEADAQLRLKLQTDIKTQVAQGIATRASIKDVKSNLGHAMQDWTRDLDRIASTETSRAMNEGLAAQIAQGPSGAEAEVSVLSSKKCCSECQKFYTGPDGAPFIFKLTGLQANGTNYKKKKAEWQAVTPPMHPNCQCTLVKVPKRYGYNDNNDLVPKGPRGIRPHAVAAKSLSHWAQDLVKSGSMSAQNFDWYGLKLTDIAPLPMHGTYKATLWTPTGSTPCTVGPNDLAANAYVAHMPHGDHVVLGYHHHEGAQAALASSEAAGGWGPSAWNSVPVHELAIWAAAPKPAEAPKPRVTLRGGSLEPLVRADTVAKLARPPKAADDLEGRFLLPMTRTVQPIKPSKVSAIDRVMPKAEDDLRPKRVAKPKPVVLATAPVVLHVAAEPNILGQGAGKDDPVGEQVALAIKRRAKRMPVEDIVAEETP